MVAAKLSSVDPYKTYPATTDSKHIHASLFFQNAQDAITTILFAIVVECL